MSNKCLLTSLVLSKQQREFETVSKFCDCLNFADFAKWANPKIKQYTVIVWV
jgi:hypothetical protein